jgi:hypothetical protein
MPCDERSSSSLHLFERISELNWLDIMHYLPSRLRMSNGFRKSDILHSWDIFISRRGSMHRMPHRKQMCYD